VIPATPKVKPKLLPCPIKVSRNNGPYRGSAGIVIESLVDNPVAFLVVNNVLIVGCGDTFEYAVGNLEPNNVPDLSVTMLAPKKRKLVQQPKETITSYVFFVDFA